MGIIPIYNWSIIDFNLFSWCKKNNKYLIKATITVKYEDKNINYYYIRQ